MIGIHSASSLIPGLPGAHNIFVTSGELDNAQQSACSLAPFPKTNTFILYPYIFRQLNYIIYNKLNKYINMYNLKNNESEMDYTNIDTTNFKEYTVTELSSALKKTIEVNFDVVHVRGEISSLTVARSGHTYFSLKDDLNIIQVVIWSRVSQSISLNLEEGMEVVVIGKVSTYAPQSKYNLIASSIELAGEGALLKLIEDRRRKLAEEGLFDEKHKKPLPYLPKTIGIITSQSGAAFHDIIIRVKERFPVNILLISWF